MKIFAVITGMIVLLVSSSFAFYQQGKVDGTVWGYEEGIRVADAWKARAMRCEATGNKGSE